MVTEKARLFELHRKTMEGVAYRMLGSLAEASEAAHSGTDWWISQVEN